MGPKSLPRLATGLELTATYRFEDVCEDAITFKQKSGTSTVVGGGAKSADDKVLQFNGFGNLVVNGYWKVYTLLNGLARIELTSVGLTASRTPASSTEAVATAPATAASGLLP